MYIIPFYSLQTITLLNMIYYNSLSKNVSSKMNNFYYIYNINNLLVILIIQIFKLFLNRLQFK